MGNSSTTINEGKVECHAPDRKAYLSDIVSCIFFQLPYKLEDIQFGYITAFFIIIVILISIFGRIKRHYRWFILNQAFFDLIITYDFACNKFGYAKNANCYFGYDSFLKAGGEIKNFSKEDRNGEIVIIKFFPAYGLLLLTASRFLNIYFPNIFKKFDKTWKLILCKFSFILSSSGKKLNARKFNICVICKFLSIIILDVLFITFIAGIWTIEVLHQNIVDECVRWNSIENDFVFKDIICKKYSNDLICIYLSEQRFYSCMQRREFSTVALLTFFSLNFTGNYPILIILSILFVLSLLFKLVKQLKFQATTNREMLKVNIRIIIVLLVQTSFLAILGLFKFLDNTFSINFLNDGKYFQLPYWVQYIIREEKNVRSYQEIRVFVDAIIVLAFMSGYREDLIDALKWICKLPVKMFKKFQ